MTSNATTVKKNVSEGAKRAMLDWDWKAGPQDTTEMSDPPHQLIKNQKSVQVWLQDGSPEPGWC